MADLAHIIREAAALSAAGDAALAKGAALNPHTRGQVLSLAPGTRVLDLVTGLEGVIVDGHTEQILISGASDGQR